MWQWTAYLLWSVIVKYRCSSITNACMANTLMLFAALSGQPSCPKQAWLVDTHFLFCHNFWDDKKSFSGGQMINDQRINVHTSNSIEWRWCNTSINIEWGWCNTSTCKSEYWEYQHSDIIINSIEVGWCNTSTIIEWWWCNTSTSIEWWWCNTSTLYNEGDVILVPV